jgi:hypothetical protein
VDALLAASLAHLAAMGVGLGFVLRRAVVARLIDWPLRDIGKIGIGSFLLAACVAPLGFEGHAVLTLMARGAVGFLIHAGAMWRLDVAGLRVLVTGAVGPPREEASQTGEARGSSCMPKHPPEMARMVGGDPEISPYLRERPE